MILLLVFAMLMLSGCPSTEADKSSPGEKSTLAGATLRAGDTSWRFESHEKGYRLEAGAQKLVIKVESDRIKVADASGKDLAKAKTKPEGFKVYDGDDKEVLRAKRRGDGYKLKRLPADEELDPQDVVIDKSGAMWIVKRKGQVVAEISDQVPKHAVSFLAVTEVTFEQRVAMLVHAVELPP